MHRYFTAYPEDAEKVVLSIKSGIADMKTFKMDCSPAAIRASVDRANAILAGTKKIDVFGPGRIDPKTPVEETVRELGELVKEGKIGGIQLSEVRAETIRRAAAVARIDMVESEVSLWATDVLENGVADVCRELGIVLVAHTPLGAGMLTGKIKSVDDMPENDHHRFFPRFQPENFDINLRLVDKVEQLAGEKGCTPAQLALAWIRALSATGGRPVMIPVPGARSVGRALENSRDVDVTEKDLKAIQEILASCPIAGQRYPPAAAKLAEY